MGIRISKWELAREVSRAGELGVVSGTVMDTVLVRELQNGDPEGSMRRALASFPDQGMAQRIMDKYYIEGGKDVKKPYKNLPMWTDTPSQHLLEACILANYCEVWLAKHNDDSSPINGLVGLNLLTKVQLPTIASLYGAMLADVDFVLMGAGKRTVDCAMNNPTFAFHACFNSQNSVLLLERNPNENSRNLGQLGQG